MKGRYKITREYFGLFDEITTIAVTDALSDAVYLCETLNKAEEERCTVEYDFKKTVREVDEGLDFVAGDSFLDLGFVCDCKNLDEYRKKVEEFKAETIKKESNVNG